MIEIKDKRLCCGCSACGQVCPTGSISMVEDREGFLYPAVSLDTCTRCGLCERVCPVVNRYDPSAAPKAFAVRNTDEATRMASSSGGVFSALAGQVFKSGGNVCGAVYDYGCDCVRHICTDDVAALPMLRGSKYIQSVCGDCFSEVRARLLGGTSVMFCGTPCQVAGLRHYLRRDYDNLLLVEVICHGVPSAKVWRGHLKGLIRRWAKCGGTDSPELKDVSFRSKRRLGWKDYCIELTVDGGDDGSGEVIYSAKSMDDMFMKGFMKNLYLRPSCYDCPARSGRSRSDITLGDFWGVWNTHPELDDDKGTGLAIVHTEKGLHALNTAGLEMKEVPLEQSLEMNPLYISSVSRPAKEREAFFRRMAEGMENMDDVTRDLLSKNTDVWKIMYRLRRIVKRIKIVTYE